MVAYSAGGVEKKPPITAEEIISQNVKMLKSSLQSEKSPGLAETRKKFEKIYEKLPEATKKIADSYHSLLSQYHLNPGEIRVYMVGGRVKGKPLSEDSDIDLVFAVKDVSKSAESSSVDWILKHSIQEGLVGRFTYEKDKETELYLKPKYIPGSISAACRELGIANEFHVLDFGTKFPEELNKPGSYLLIGISKAEAKQKPLSEALPRHAD
jgi:hypothetical protein